MSEVAAGPSRSEALRPYVPRLIIDWLRTSPDERVREVEGTLAFADISGFTRLTERLSRLGRVGAEEMSDTLDSTFGTLLGVAYADGAQLLKWGGDAVLLFFDGADHAARACHAAFGMRAAIRDLGRLRTAAGAVELRMSTGIHSGAFHLFLVGDPRRHRELIVCGPGVSATARMESAAGAAGIALTPEAAAQVDPRLLTRSGDVFMLRAQPPAVGRYSRTAPDIAGLDLARCLPTPIRDHLLAAAGESEHRNVSVAFVGFSGADELLEAQGAQALASALEDLVRNVQDATARNGVTFFESDIDVGGGKIMLTAGAPTSAGHDEDRMLRTARVVVDRMGALAVRVGVNRGNVFAGDFGPHYRRTYSIKGDAVNVAARLMGKAGPGQVIASAAVAGRSQTEFALERLEPLTLKGKATPVQAFRVGAPLAERRVRSGDAALVGREAELAALLDAWEQARRGRGRLIELVGEPGIGKSSVVAALMARAEGASVLHATADPYESSTPYFAWKGLLREIVGVPAAATPPDDAELLARRIEVLDRGQLPWLPLAGIPMGIHVEATDATHDLDERFRKPRMEEVTAALVAAALGGPTLLVLDDVHLLDDPSAGLLERIRRDVASLALLVVVTRRDQATGFVPEAGPDVTRISLRPLGEGAAADLLSAFAGDTALRPDELATLVRRAAGNPLFLKELVAAAVGAGSVASLPDSIEGLVTTQIDRLSPQERTILRYASVLGTTFTRPLLREMLSGGRAVLLDELPASLDTFLVGESGDIFRFQHSLIRDAAYEGLPFRRRRELHGRAGAAIEASSKDPDDQAELLSMHYFHASLPDKAWHYSVVAGDRARAQYANPEAADFYARAVEAARRVQGLAAEDVARVHESLGDVRYVVGNSQSAISAYAAARSLVRGTPLKQAGLIRKVARIEVRLGRFPQALRLLTRGRRVLEGVTGETAGGIRAILAAEYAVCRGRQGHLREAMGWARMAVGEADASGERTARATAYHAIDTVHKMSGLTPDRPYDRLAQDLYEEMGDLAAQAQILNNIAIGSIFDGHLGDALEMFHRARAIYERVGDATRAGSVGHNMGQLLTTQGRVDEAEPILRESMRVARSVGDREAVVGDMRELGRGAAHRGRFEEAMRLLDQACSEATEMGLTHEIAETQAAIAECVLLAGNPQRALSEAAGALGNAEQAGAARVLGSLARIRGFALLELGRNAEARAAFDDALRLTAEPGTQHERAFALAGLARLAERAGDAAGSAVLAAQSHTLLDGLGVVSVPITSWVDVRSVTAQG